MRKSTPLVKRKKRKTSSVLIPHENQPEPAPLIVMEQKTPSYNPYKKGMQTPEQLRAFMIFLIGELRQGRIRPSALNACIYTINTIIKIDENIIFMQRLAAIEEAIKQNKENK